MKWRVTHIPVVSFLARRKAYPYLSSLIAVGQLLHLISTSDSQFLPAGSSHISLMLPEFQVYSSVSNIPPKKKLQICMFLQCACLTFFSCFHFFGTRALTLPRQGPPSLSISPTSPQSFHHLHLREPHILLQNSSAQFQTQVHLLAQQNTQDQQFCQDPNFQEPTK